MVPAGNKAKRVSSVNHTTKTIQIYTHTKMSGGNKHFNSDWLSFKNSIDVLILFWCKRKDTLLVYFTFRKVSVKSVKISI